MWKQKLISSFLLLFFFFGQTGFSSSFQSEQPAVRIRITQVDTSDFPNVTVYIAITDANNQPVGIDPARLTLMENGTPIPLDQIEGAGEVGTLTTLLVMDISGSMLYAEKLEAAKSSATVFINQLRPGDQIGLVSFNHQIKYVQPITTDHQQVIRAVNGLNAVADTAMYDGLSVAIKILEPVTGRKAILALTDGLDNLSLITPEAVIELIGPAGLSISTIGLGDPDQGKGALTALNEDVLTYLAENAGGVYGYANDKESLSSLYQSYAAAFKSEYQLTYTSPAALRDGVNRNLSVTLSGPASTILEAGDVSATYNPGGLVPEVSEPAPWPVFWSLIGGLTLLLFLPSLIKRGSGLVKSPVSRGGLSRKNKPKITFTDKM